MGILLSIKKLFENGLYVGDCAEKTSIPCDKISSNIRKAYLRRVAGCCGDNSITPTLTFDKPTQADGTTLEANALEGFWIEVDGKGTLVDATTQAAIVDACNACCGATPSVAGNYGGGVPAITEATTSTFCLTRSDDGGQQAINKVAMDYYGKYVSITFKSQLSGVSQYEIVAYSKPSPIGADTIANGACATPTVPAAPTAPVTDDTANTFNWTNNPLYTAVSDYEQTTDGGATWVALTAKPIAGLTGVHAIGSVGVRVKAAGINPASAGLFNAVAFS